MRFLPSSYPRVWRTLLLALSVAVLSAGAACGGDDPTVDADASSETDSGGDSSRVTVDTTPGAEGEPQVFGKEQNGETVQMQVDEEVVVSLESCPSCGYHWEITSPPDGSVVEPSDASETPGPNQSEDGTPMVGASSTIEFFFKATGAGTTTVEIGYFPPADDKAEETYTLTFVVR